jgi:CHRD domain
MILLVSHKYNPIFLCFLIATQSLTVFALGAVTQTGNAVYAQDDGDDDGDNQEQDLEFSANLTGQAEVPPVITNATGETTFSLNDDGDEMTYELDVEDIEAVFAAHIHQGHPMQNGPILVTLYNVSESTDEDGGSLAGGEFTAEDFESAFQGRNMSSLVDRINGERAYVDVHTQSHPNGELRGIMVPVIEENEEETTDDDNDN